MPSRHVVFDLSRARRMPCHLGSPRYVASITHIHFQDGRHATMSDGSSWDGACSFLMLLGRAVSRYWARDDHCRAIRQDTWTSGRLEIFRALPKDAREPSTGAEISDASRRGELQCHRRLAGHHFHYHHHAIAAYAISSPYHDCLARLRATR